MIQNSQNRDSKAVHLKLDELICSIKHARNLMVNVEDMDDDKIAELAEEFRRRRHDPETPPHVREKLARIAVPLAEGDDRDEGGDDRDHDEDDDEDDDEAAATAPSAH